MKKELGRATLSVLIMLFVSEACLANQFKERLFEQQYPFPSFQLSRFVSCAEGSIEIIPIDTSYEQFLVITRKLNEKCFGEVSGAIAANLYESISDRKHQRTLDPKSYRFDLEFGWAESQLASFPYETSRTLSPVQLKCGESCEYAVESLIKVGQDYYFLSYSSDFGIGARMITKEVILFEVKNSTHKRL